MRRKDREITDPAEIRGIIDASKLLHLALNDEGCPYVVPMHYGYEYIGALPVLYMHCASEGHRLDLIRRDPRACIELETDVEITSGGEVPCLYGCNFRSVIARGTVSVLPAGEEKLRALRLLMKHQTGRDFDITPQMAQTVQVLRFAAEELTAKARQV